MSADSKQYMMALGYDEAIQYRAMRKKFAEYGDVLEIDEKIYVYVKSNQPAHKMEWILSDGDWNREGIIVERLDTICVEYDAVEDVAQWKLRKDMPDFGIPLF